jgi:hypothetical protein
MELVIYKERIMNDELKKSLEVVDAEIAARVAKVRDMTAKETEPNWRGILFSEYVRLMRMQEDFRETFYR